MRLKENYKMAVQKEIKFNQDKWHHYKPSSSVNVWNVN